MPVNTGNTMTISYAPHIHDNATTNRIMRDVIIALSPALLLSIWIFGPRAALVTCVCVAACVFFEWVFEKILKRKNTISDLSAVVTGMLLAFNLPVTIPLWQAIFGCAVAIIMVKQIFGGLGKNFANPAITARIAMFLAFPVAMTTWAVPAAGFHWLGYDAITGATPLAIMAHSAHDALSGATSQAMAHSEQLPGLWHMFLGLHGGCIGETSELALLIGGLYLIFRRVITWHAPVTFIAVVFILTTISGNSGINHILSGGLFLGAIFMATDYVTTPLTNSGRIIFGAGAGALAVLIRLYGSYPEGISFAILIMNMIVPFINKLTVRKALGGKEA